MSEQEILEANGRELVERTLDEVLPPADARPGVLSEAMREAVGSGGKRIRPLVCLAAAVAAGSVTAKVSAWALNEPPPYMVVDLAVKGWNAVRYFASAEELPYGGVTNDAYKTDLLVLRKCPAENVTWRMGAPTNEVGVSTSWETPRLVTLTNDFYIGVYPVTQKQYFNLKGTWPSFYTARRETRPLENMSYERIRGQDKNGESWRPAPNRASSRA